MTLIVRVPTLTSSISVDAALVALLMEGRTFFVNLLAFVISFANLESSPKRNSEDASTVELLHKAA